MDITKDKGASQRMKFLVSSDSDNDIGLRACESEFPMKVQFDNRTSSRANLFWIDYDGEFVYVGELKPHGKKVVNTFEGHPWICMHRKNTVKFVIDGNTVYVPFIPSAPVPAPAENGTSSPGSSLLVVPVQREIEATFSFVGAENQTTPSSIKFFNRCSHSVVLHSSGVLDDGVLLKSGQCVLLGSQAGTLWQAVSAYYKNSRLLLNYGKFYRCFAVREGKFATVMVTEDRNVQLCPASESSED